MAYGLVCANGMHDIVWYPFFYLLLYVNESITNHSIQCIYQHSVAKDGLSILLSHGMYHCMNALFQLYSIVTAVTPV